MPEIKSQELTLEEYKYEVSVYKKYKEEISKFREKLAVLEKKKKSFNGSYFLSYGISLFLVLFFLNRDPQADFWSNFLSSIFIAIYPALIFGAVFDTDFLNNLFSFGELNKIKKLSEETRVQVESVEELKDKVYKKLQPFEKAVCNHYQAQLAEFFEQNLYKKRSGNQQFEEAIAEFSSTIEEISPINSTLVTNRISLDEYREYLKKRTINHKLQALKKSDGLASVRNFVKSISEPQKQKEVISPERLYRTARKVDNWEEINKKRKKTGNEGEEIVVAIEQDFFESIGRKDLAQKVRHVSAEDGDGLGYDVLSFFENGSEKYIEVKSTTASLNSPFYLSRNELGFLKEHSEDAVIYRVFVSEDAPQMRSDSIVEVLEKNDLIPVQYMVKTK
jgi:hypothetical protein